MLTPLPLIWAQQDLPSLEAALKGKQLVLRSFSADSLVQYTWANGTLAANPPKVLTLGAFKTRSVKLKRDKIIVDGERSTFLQDGERRQIVLTGGTPMKLEIDLLGADSDTIVPHLQELLFFPDRSAVVAALPQPIAAMLPIDISHAHVTDCNCNRFSDNGHWDRIARPSAEYTPTVFDLLS